MICMFVHTCVYISPNVDMTQCMKHGNQYVRRRRRRASYKESSFSLMCTVFLKYSVAQRRARRKDVRVCAPTRQPSV